MKLGLWLGSYTRNKALPLLSFQPQNKACSPEKGERFLSIPKHIKSILYIFLPLSSVVNEPKERPTNHSERNNSQPKAKNQNAVLDYASPGKEEGYRRSHHRDDIFRDTPPPKQCYLKLLVTVQRLTSLHDYH